MTMTDKPSPATLLPCPFCGVALTEIDTKRLLPLWAHPTVPSECPIAQITIGNPAQWNTRHLDIPSSCSSSHQEIRYTGETCPLCEANQSRHEAVKRWEAVALELEQERDTARAALSRPSEAPVPKPCFPECGAAVTGHDPAFSAFSPLRVFVHAPACPNKPGAGEEGK